MFRKYMHVERFGNDAVEGIELGKCYIFPKIDGTNSSLWLEDNKICAGSRNRKLTLDNDNAGFFQASLKDFSLVGLVNSNPNLIFYGEWLVPHSLKTYDEDAWRKFYIFDVYDRITSRYLHFDVYKHILEYHEANIVHPIAIFENCSYDNLLDLLPKNTFLIKDGHGSGEGVVIKNYEYQNKYGKNIFAKVVQNSFKDIHKQEMGIGTTKFKELVEQDIVNKYINIHLIDKVYNKIKTEDLWDSSKIPQLFGRVYYDLVTEEMWDIIKIMKNPTINYKTLYTLLIRKIKELKPELFQ